MKAQGYACEAFKMESAEQAWMHMENFDVVEHYGAECNGKCLHVFDEGRRYLAKCRRCGGFILVQKSELHGPEDDDYYADYFPVTGPDQAHALNKRFDGYEIECSFGSRFLMTTNMRIHWSKMHEIKKRRKPCEIHSEKI